MAEAGHFRIGAFSLLIGNAESARAAAQQGILADIESGRLPVIKAGSDTRGSPLEVIGKDNPEKNQACAKDDSRSEHFVFEPEFCVNKKGYNSEKNANQPGCFGARPEKRC